MANVLEAKLPLGTVIFKPCCASGTRASILMKAV